MKYRSKPKIWRKKDIATTRKWEKIGYIQLVSYMRGDSIPHIEYEINKEFRNQGIMSEELPKYLKECKKWEFNQLVALVECSNIASVRLLEKNGFVKVKEIEGFASYIVDLRLHVKEMEAMLRDMRKMLPTSMSVT